MYTPKPHIKQQVLLWGLLFCALMGAAQVRFNKRIDTGFPNTILTSVVEGTDGYFCTGFLGDTMGLAAGRPMVFLKLSWDGEVLIQDQHGGQQIDQNLRLSSQNPDLVFWNDTTLIHSGHSFDVNGVRQGYIAHHNLQGDTLSLIRFHSPNYPADDPFYNFIATLRVVIAADGNYLALSNFENPETNTDFIIQKWTPEGELLWTFEYATEADPEFCRTLVATDDGGCYAIPVSYLNESVAQEHHILKISGDGVLDWDTVVASLEPIPSFRDIELVDANFIGTTYIKHDELDEFIPCIVKMSIEGDVDWITGAWEEDYSPSHYVEQLDKTLDGGYVFCGEHWENVTNPTDTSGDANINAFLAKVDSDGQLEWSRKYHYLNVPNDNHQVYDVRATSDGGYIFCGEATDQVPGWGFSEAPYQQGWVVKVDEYGCLVEGCELYDNVEEVNTIAPLFTAGPNPASDFLNIYLPRNLSASARFELHALDGKRLEQFSAHHPPGTTLMLEVSHYPSGVYLLSLLDEGELVEQVKVVVE